MVNTSAIANSIFTYFISYKFYCGKGKKKEENKRSSFSIFVYLSAGSVPMPEKCRCCQLAARGVFLVKTSVGSSG